MIHEQVRSLALELHMLMHFVHKVSRTALEQRLLQHGIELSGLQYGILRFLHHEGDHTISELSRKFVLDPSTLVPVIDTLERKRLVVRGHDPSDRRRNPLSLTDEGVKLIHEVTIVDDDDALVIGIKNMGEEASGQLLELMRLLVRNLPDGEEMIQGIQSRLGAHGVERIESCKQFKTEIRDNKDSR
jgi:DNA-binding MarR family transcriptional regulator